MHLHFQLTEQCNLCCPGCYLQERVGQGKPAAEVEARVLAPLSELGLRHVTLTGGEPLLHKDWLAISKAAARYFKDVLLVCNGTLLTQEVFRKLQQAGVNQIKVSLDSLLPEVHDRGRGIPGTLEKVQKNLESIQDLPLEVRTAVQLGLITTITEENVSELLHLATWALHQGIDHILFQPHHPFAMVYPPRSKHDRPTVSDEFLDILQGQVEGLLKLKREKPLFLDNSSEMLQLFPSFYLAPDGPEQTCGADRYLFVDSSLQVRGCLFSEALGDLGEQEPFELLHSEAWQGFHQFRASCKLCLMGCQFVTAAERKMEAGWTALSKGLYDGARAIFQDSLDTYPTIQGEHGLAVAEKNLGNHKEAIIILTSITERAEDFVWARLDLADALRISGQLVEAHSQIKIALSRFPGKADVRLQFGLILREMGEHLKAEREFVKAISLNPNNPWPHFELGKLLVSKGRADEAEEEFREAIRLDPALIWPQYELGKLLARKGDFRAAEQELRGAIRLNPSIACFHYDLGRLLVGNGNNIEAETEFREAIRLDPSIACFHYDLGRLLVGNGNNIEAETEFREAIRLEPMSIFPYFQLGTLLLKRGRPIEGLTTYGKMVVAGVRRMGLVKE